MIDKFNGQYDFLSNFYPSTFIDSISFFHYPTVEHYFQGQKGKTVKDQVMIFNAPSPSQAKKLGRTVTLRSDWEEVKDQIMWRGVLAKFTQNHDLAQKLIDTADQELIEGNYWHDNYWGNCYCPKCKNIPGKNMLGKILMEVREILKEKR